MDALACNHVQLVFCVGINFSVIYLDVISTTSHKCIVHFKATRHGFACTSSTSSKVNQQGKMACFIDNARLVSAGWKSYAMNMNLKT
jgi:hypothetical protein